MDPRGRVRPARPPFRVVVVGNRAPRLALPAQTQFVDVDVPALSRRRGCSPEPRLDKGMEVAVVLAAMRHAPDHVTAFDADDFVSDRLARITNGDPGAPEFFAEVEHVRYELEPHIPEMARLSDWRDPCIPTRRLADERCSVDTPGFAGVRGGWVRCRLPEERRADGILRCVLAGGPPAGFRGKRTVAILHVNDRRGHTSCVPTLKP